MCSVEKMLIKGVRSFSPYNEDAITFFKPLTIIVGPNGSGKTTVIECLKQACTGSLPPTCSKQRAAFIHDPKISGQTETRAQIKLRFKEHSNGNPVVLVKSFLLTVKGTTSTFKAADQTVKKMDPETGETESYSCKVQDVERLVPTLMGASQAVLDSVVFVHQDEMNWPLDDPATVKKKFDAIFNLSGYTKAVDAMKKVRLQNNHEIEKHKLKCSHLKTILDRSNVLKAEIAADEEAIDEMDGVISGFQRKADEEGAEAERLSREAASRKDLFSECEVLQGKLEVLERSSAQLKERLREESEESVEELEELKQKMREQLNVGRLKLKSKQDDLRALEREEKELQEKFRENETLESRLFAEIEVGRREARETRQELSRLAAEVLPGQGTQWREGMEDEEASENYAAVERMSRDIEKKAREARQEGKRRERDLGDAVRAAETVVHRAEDKGRAAEARRREIGDLVDEIERWSRGVQVSEEEHRDAEAKEAELAEDLGRVIREQEVAERAKAGKGLDAEIDGLRSACERLRAEKDGIQEDAARNALRNERQVELERSRSKLNGLVESNRLALGDCLDVGVPGGAEVLGSLQARADSLERSKAEASEERTRAEAKLEAVSSRLALERRVAEEKRREHREREDQVGEPVSQETKVEDLVLQKEEKAKKIGDRIVMIGAYDKVFSTYIDNASETGACPACKRPFSEGHEELDEFLCRTRESRDQCPEKLENAKRIRDELLAEVDALRAKAGLVAEVGRLAGEAGEAEDKAKATAEEEASLRSALGKLGEKEKSLSEKLASCRTLVKDVGLPCHSLAESISELERALEAEGGQGLQASRSVAEVKLELSAAEADLKQKVAEREDRDAALLALNGRRSECEARLREHRELRARQEGNAAELALKLAEKKRLEGERADLEQGRDALDRELASARDKLEDARHELGKESRRIQREVDAKDEEARDLSRKAEQMKRLCEKLQRDDTKRSETKLRRLQTDQESLKDGISLVSADTSRKRSEVQAEERAISDRGELFRSIDDNIEYKRGQAEVARVRAEAAERRGALESLGDGEALASELKARRDAHEEATRKVQYLRGSRKTLEQKIRERREELGGREFRDIQNLHRAESAALKTKKQAVGDIDAYVKALRKALISFHNRKMQNINKTIKELWQKTYRNSDIDYIRVRYEEGTGRSGHNYRVQMVSGGTELDMRGRCSAGQRVLASIIIRLALAETFCIDCGILALDEPTTNLDEENARSLALMLQQIIRDRSQQRNFQLIVITHDEKFAQMIGRRTFCEHYWYVHKDENQHSKILRQEVLE